MKPVCMPLLIPHGGLVAERATVFSKNNCRFIDEFVALKRPVPSQVHPPGWTLWLAQEICSCCHIRSDLLRVSTNDAAQQQRHL